MSSIEKVTITLSAETVTKATALMNSDDIGIHSVIDRALDTQAWVEEKQTAGKTVLAATGTKIEDVQVWSDYEYLSPEPTFDAGAAE